MTKDIMEMKVPVMKPLTRGYTHQFAFYVSLCACGILLTRSNGILSIFANTLYSLTLSGMFGVSALYHCITWNPRKYLLMRRIDHATIYALIAGSATPVFLLGIKGDLGWRLFAVMWLLALTGMILAIFWTKGPKWIRAFLYIAIGWLPVPYLAEIKSGLGATNMALLVDGGIIYTLGAFIYALKWPNPFPRHFGYHEIFHLFVIIASALYFIIIFNLTN